MQFNVLYHVKHKIIEKFDVINLYGRKNESWHNIGVIYCDMELKF